MAATRTGGRQDTDPDAETTTDDENRQDDRQDAGSDATPVDRILDSLGRYATARGQQLVDKAGDRITGAAERLTEVAEGGGAGILPAVGLRKAKGESTAKAVASTGMSKMKDKLGGLMGKGGKGDRGGSSGAKFMNITETIDVGVPVRVAYNHWTRYEEFSDWAKGVRGVDQGDDETSSNWKVKVGPSGRSWKATVRTQVPDERIVWTSEGAKGTTHGVVTFHELGERLTRIVVVVEYYPSGPIEKIGNLWRAQGRRLRLDLKHFRRHVTFSEEEDPEGWRGEIRDGEIVSESDEEESEEQDEEPDEEGAEDEFDEDEDYDEEPEDEDYDEDEDEEPEDYDEDEGDEEYEDEEPEDEFDEEELEEEEEPEPVSAGGRRRR